MHRRWVIWDVWRKGLSRWWHVPPQLPKRKHYCVGGQESSFTEHLLCDVLLAVAEPRLKPKQLVLDLWGMIRVRFSDLSFLIWQTGIIACLFVSREVGFL